MNTVTSPEQDVSEIEIEQAIHAGIERYFDDCRARILDGFDMIRSGLL